MLAASIVENRTFSKSITKKAREIGKIFQSFLFMKFLDYNTYSVVGFSRKILHCLHCSMGIVFCFELCHPRSISSYRTFTHISDNNLRIICLC